MFYTNQQFLQVRRRQLKALRANAGPQVKQHGGRMEAPVAVIDQSLTDQPRQPGRHFFRLWHTLFVSLANVLDDVRISDQMSTELSPVIRLH
ncbi:hypothetical protein JTM41_33110, partial [Pseudomonas aeruginosa]|nr:hypothetical protein [Pseudomonas aeruginosa]